jgi:drug/metabolite transporter (DMT)-like permease
MSTPPSAPPRPTSGQTAGQATVQTTGMTTGMTGRTWAELVLLGAIWGGSFVGNSLALSAFGILPTVALRLTGACLVLWAYVLWRGLPLPRGWRIWGAFAVMGLFNNALPFSLITWGQQTVPAGLAAIINSSTAIFGVLIAALVFPDERLSPRKLTGVAIGFLGVIVAIGIGTLASFSPASAGQLACLAAAASYGLSAAWARARLSHLPHKRVLLFGMSGLGKTHLSNMLRDTPAPQGGAGSTTRSITGSAPATWANISPTTSSARR